LDVGGDRVTGEQERQGDHDLWQARQNIAQLIPFLEKVKSQLPFFYEAEEFAVAVVSALNALPQIAEMLPKVEPRPDRRPADQRYQLCASLVVEGWRMTRGTAPTAGGRREADACRAYWRACGHDDASRDWERDLRAAIHGGDPMLRAHLQMLADRQAVTA
jgi:hypothetical protein